LVSVGLACVVILIVPGPSVLFIVGRALSYGRRTALFSILGNSVGSYLAAVCVSVGLGPFLQRSDLLFQTIKLLGAAYLVWLGVQAWRRGGHVPDPDDTPPPIQSPWRAVRTGVFVGVTNPKTFIAGQAREWLAGTPRRTAALGRIGGVSMIGLGVSVAVTGRHD
jgi:threonine/homoserine/homoserine lactone efflux protein